MLMDGQGMLRRFCSSIKFCNWGENLCAGVDV